MMITADWPGSCVGGTLTSQHFMVGVEILNLLMLLIVSVLLVEELKF